MKGSMESINNYVPGGKAAIADAYNSSNGNGDEAARKIEAMSGNRTTFGGESDGYAEFNVYKYANSTKPAVIRVDTNAERRTRINKRNTRNINNMMMLGR